MSSTEAGRTVTLSDGRVLTLRDLKPSETLNLYDAVGAGTSANAAWMSVAEIVASVASIKGVDGIDVPLALPSAKSFVLSVADRIGREGIRKVSAALSEANAGAVDEELAKN